jgi:hypothetical protein
MFNVYAQRATNPKDMDSAVNEFLHRENMKAFRYVMEMYGEGRKPSIWAAWGTIIETRKYLPSCVRDMISIGKKYSAEWFTAGARSKKAGHPHHPLYLQKDSKLDPFDVSEYLDSLTV